MLYFKMSVWVAFFYVFAVFVIAIKYLHPIGEGERYLEMTLVPTAIISSVLFHSLLKTDYNVLTTSIFLVALFTNLAITLISQWLGIIYDKTRSLHKDMNQVFAYINRMKPIPRILCIPHQITTMVLFNTKAQVLVDIQAGTLQKIPDVFPILKKPVKELAKKYNLTLLVLKKDYATLTELHLSKSSVIFETNDTQVIKL